MESTIDVSEVEVFKPIPLDKLEWWWLNDIVPVFVATVPDICKHIEAHGFQIYYVIATEKYSVKVDNYTKTEKRPQVFKITSTIIGKSIVPAEDDVKLGELEANAWFALPKIPFYLVEMMDDFFRLVEDELHTESIVLLTYDSEKQGPDGWGVLVPSQENTSHDCDYDPASITEDKPDSVFIVGSAHSHPGMSAYASGTDHKDQASFDGIHITYGWMASKNNGKTEYHIELQSGGKAFQFNADQVFESFPTKEPSADVKDWTKKVTKKYASTTTHQGYTQSHSQQQLGSGMPGTSGAPITKKVVVPIACPNPSTNIIIGRVYDEDTKCPFCATVMITVDRDKRRCMSCHQYLALRQDGVADIVEARTVAGVYTVDIDIVGSKPTKDIYIWERPSGGGDVFNQVYEAPGK